MADKTPAPRGTPSDLIRKDKTLKGPGFLGSIPTPGHKYATELSIGVHFDGKEQLIPSLVPGLTPQEVQWITNGNKSTSAIVRKAVDHARRRIAQGKSVFLEAGEKTEGRPVMPDDKPSRSKEVLGSKKDEPTLRELRRMSLEHTANGHIKATHDYGDDKPEIHALPKDGFFDHLKKSFNLSEEKKAIDAKQANVDTYEKAHGSLTKPAATPVAAAVAPSSYDKIRSDLREKAARPPASDRSLDDRFNALTKSLNR